MGYKAQFPVGAKVRMKPGAESAYRADIQRRVQGGRLGIVTGHTFPSEIPLVTLPKNGRKQEYRLGQIHVPDWEVVELPK